MRLKKKVNFNPSPINKDGKKEEIGESPSQHLNDYFSYKVINFT